MCIETGDLWAQDSDEKSNEEIHETASSVRQPNENAESMSEAILRHLGEIKRNNIADNL